MFGGEVDVVAADCCIVSVMMCCTADNEVPPPALTVDAACFIAVVRTVVDFITLLGAMDTGAIATLELIWPTCEQG